MRSEEVNGILVAAHDLKAPLALMRQLALSLDLADNQSSRQRIQSQLVSVSERAMRQVNDLAKIARLEDGLFEMEPLSVRNLCDEVARELRPLFQYENRQLSLSFNNRSRLAIANHDLLHSVIYNFCTNAIRYSDHDTTSILAVTDARDKIRIGVRDFGPALPPKIWRKLHQGTFNTPTNIAMRPGSSGLGLYIASEFAHHMRAQIGAIRHRDGTSFFIDLPISNQMSFSL